jgi:lysophospholipase
MILNNYSADLKLFIDTVVKKDDPEKIVLLGYSMGGTISLDYLINYDHTIDKLILCSPMLKIRTFLPERIVYFIVNLLIKFNKETDYIPGGDKYDFSRVFFNLSSSKIRYSMFLYLRELYPMIILKAPTNRWLKEAIKATRIVRREVKKIDTPVLLLQAEKEKVVDIRSQNKLAEYLSHCHKIRISKARHDLLLEKDSMRNKTIKAMLDFLE